MWTGPTLLLAPCQHMLAGHAATPPPSLRRLDAESSPVLVVHGTEDKVVPYQDSVALADSAEASHGRTRNRVNCLGIHTCELRSWLPPRLFGAVRHYRRGEACHAPRLRFLRASTNFGGTLVHRP